jgi:hypothetical protein
MQNSQELVLMIGGNADLGLELPVQAKLGIQGQLEKRYSAERIVAEGRGEKITIEIPARVHTKYVFTWREVRKQGQISYVENGQIKTAEFDYRVRIEYSDVRAEALICPGQPEPTGVVEIPTPLAPTQSAGTVYSPGQDWTNNCISAGAWTLVPQSNVALSNGCFNQPLPGGYFTQDGKLIIRYTDALLTSQPYGFFTKLTGSSGKVTLSFDIDKLQQGRIFIGIYSGPALNNEGVAILTASGRVEDQTFTLRYAKPQLDSVTYSVVGDRGRFTVELELSPGDMDVKLQSLYNMARDIPLNFSERWLFVGYLAELGTVDVNASMNLTVQP